jgi:hypothetical protein
MTRTCTEMTEPGLLHWEKLETLAGDFLAEAAVERPTGYVRNVALLGPESRNGYRYAASAMERAAPLYEGRPLFIDHPDQTPTQRKLRDYAGQVVQPRLEANKLRGDLRLLGPNAEWLFDLIEAAPRDVGLSHVVMGRRSADGLLVEQIDRVVSVDIVAFPATTQSFKEQVADGCSAAPFCPLPVDGKNRLASLRQLVAASRIPPEGRAAALEQLLAAPHDAERLLAALEQFWVETQADRPRSLERREAGQSRQLDRQVALAIKGF